MWVRYFAAGVMLVLLVAPRSLAQKAELSPDAPEDKPVSVQAEQNAQFLAAIEPYVKKATKTYPGAKRRFFSGLPAGEIFYITTRLVDPQNRWEQVDLAISLLVCVGIFVCVILAHSNQLCTKPPYHADRGLCSDF